MTGLPLEYRAYETEQGVVVPSSTVYFPKLCPVCLAPDPQDFVETKAVPGKSKHYGVVRTRKTLKMKIPHCLKCARKIRRSRGVIRISWIVLAVCLAPLGAGAIVGAIVALILGTAIAYPVSKLYKKRGIVWDPSVSIVSSADDASTCFDFSNVEYRRSFLLANS